MVSYPYRHFIVVFSTDCFLGFYKDGIQILTNYIVSNDGTIANNYCEDTEGNKYICTKVLSHICTEGVGKKPQNYISIHYFQMIFRITCSHWP
jgi:hypothetical protein